MTGEGLTVATFDWPIAQPEDTYTIDATDKLSIELDRHFPVRPAKFTLTDAAHHHSLSTIEELGGPELAQAMRVAPIIGFSILQVILSDAHRLAIANVQIASPSTPFLLRKACQDILAGIRRPTQHPV